MKKNGRIENCEILFLLSGKSIFCSTDDTILGVAEDNGIVIPNNCRYGTCGTCLVKMLTGKVVMERTDGLEEEPARRGYVLTCVGRPVGKVVVEA